MYLCNVWGHIVNNSQTSNIQQQQQGWQSMRKISWSSEVSVISFWSWGWEENQVIVTNVEKRGSTTCDQRSCFLLHQFVFYFIASFFCPPLLSFLCFQSIFLSTWLCLFVPDWEMRVWWHIDLFLNSDPCFFLFSFLRVTRTCIVLAHNNFYILPHN